MNNNINYLAKNQIIENICRNIGYSETTENIKDLIQDIYLVIIQKDQDFIKGLIDRGEINYYIANIVYTQIRSNTSAYNKTYRHKKEISINDTKIQLQKIVK